MSDKCLARLTSWERTNSPIGTSNKRASIIKLCKKTPQKGQLLCDECSSRPTGGKYQTKMCHGLLTEAPCEASHIYGSSWYWSVVAKCGDPLDNTWLEAAEEAQAAAEELCLAAGYTPWKVQRPEEGDFEDMRVKKSKADKAAAADRVAKASAAQQTLKKFVVPIKTTYEESAKPPETLPTDTCEIWKEDVDGASIWVTANGLVFASCETTGEPAELLGRRKGDDFTPI